MSHQAACLLGFWVVVSLLSALPQGHLQCGPDSLVLYHLIMKAHWSQETFPRHFPGRLAGYRPSAQWSRLIGRTHNSSYALYRVGEMASAGLKKFAETSSSDSLDEMDSTGVFDAFNAPPIASGEGQTQSQFFLDGNHSQVSLISRIVPSPDWFCGVDGVDLCLNGEWVDSLTFDVDPIDAGTDNGYTFSAPNWATMPPEAIYPINSVKLHPAHSFYRDDRSEKPKPFATITLLKLKEYSLSSLRASNPDNIPTSFHHHKHNLNHHHVHLFDELDQADIANELMEFGDFRDEQNMTPRAAKRKRSRRMRGSRSARDCAVSEWSEWSECSALCGFGEQRRNRYITNHPRGGQTCPSLSETRLCNSARECRDNYFDW
ncbi:spondin-2 [Folsomia candida]|uniref:spondin-2 n=1 Tax=Folsomia candida TaxID=158441 RepID=UPI000B902095|nr:spondin-2 [Folsomia candida]